MLVAASANLLFTTLTIASLLFLIASNLVLATLRSRGISLANARTLLLLAFVQEVIDRVTHEETKLRLTDKIITKIQTSLAI